jgi:SAM-dependent methyltransferase
MSSIDTALRNSDIAFRKKFMNAVNYGSGSAKIGPETLNPGARGYRPDNIMDSLYNVYLAQTRPVSLSAADLERVAKDKIQRMRKILGLLQGANWVHLDYGCGSGMAGAELSRTLACSYTVLVGKREPIAPGLMYIKTPELSKLTGETLEDEGVPSVYDIISCFYALQYSDPAPLLKTVASLLREGGYFLCCGYDVRSEVERARATAMYVGSAIHELPPGLSKKEFMARIATPALHFTSRDELVRIAHEAGLAFVGSTDVRETDGQYFALFSFARA